MYWVYQMELLWATQEQQKKNKIVVNTLKTFWTRNEVVKLHKVNIT